MKKRETLKNAAFFVVILLLVLAFLISGLHILESTVLQGGEEQVAGDRKTIIRDGIEYFPRQDITVMLVMGIDQTGPVQDSGAYMNHGAADVVMLVIFDEVEDCMDGSTLENPDLKDSVLLKYDVYSIAPYSSGHPELSIPHDQLEGIVSPEYL